MMPIFSPLVMEKLRLCSTVSCPFAYLGGCGACVVTRRHNVSMHMCVCDGCTPRSVLLVPHAQVGRLDFPCNGAVGRRPQGAVACHGGSGVAGPRCTCMMPQCQVSCYRMCAEHRVFRRVSVLLSPHCHNTVQACKSAHITPPQRYRRCARRLPRRAAVCTRRRARPTSAAFQTRRSGAPSTGMCPKAG